MHPKPTSGHTNNTHEMWTKVTELQKVGKVVIDGSNLDIADVVAVAK